MKLRWRIELDEFAESVDLATVEVVDRGLLSGKLDDHELPVEVVKGFHVLVDFLVDRLDVDVRLFFIVEELVLHEHFDRVDLGTTEFFISIIRSN